MIDVLIPCRDGGDTHLAQLVRSLEAQNVDVNIDVYFNTGSVADARNVLLNRNHGEFVYYVDADDWLPNRHVLKWLVEACGDDYAWGDFEAYISPTGHTIHQSQMHVRERVALGSWLARRSSFSPDPWQPLSEADPHRSDWTMPKRWKGTHIAKPIFTYRVAWSPDQLTAEPPRGRVH